MKKVLGLVAAASLIAATTAAFGASIVNSKHDLSAGSTVGGVAASYTLGSSTQICVYCHAPHAAVKSLPLWNRTNPTGTGFTLYSGVGMANVSFKTGLTDDSTSLFCMSCHDGVTSISAVHNAGVIDGTGTSPAHPFTAGTFTIGGNLVNAGAIAAGVSGNLTKDLSKTHPINFPVTANGQSDLYLGTVPSSNKMGNADQFPLFKTDVGVAGSPRNTSNRSLECGSCHAVHDTQYKPFLRATMNKSALCLGCHNK